MNVKELVELYQCPGCVSGGDTSCYEKSDNLECKKHVCGTVIPGIGHIYLGLPIGFCRKGPFEELKINIFTCPEVGWGYDKLNVPVWKHLDEHGNTLVRGMNPRINCTFIHVFMGDHMDSIDCLEITSLDISEMD